MDYLHVTDEESEVQAMQLVRGRTGTNAPASQLLGQPDGWPEGVDEKSWAARCAREGTEHCWSPSSHRAGTCGRRHLFAHKPRAVERDLTSHFLTTSAGEQGLRT